MYRAIVFVGPAGKCEEAFDREGNFPRAIFTGLRLDAGRELVAPIVEVFGQEIEDLGARMRGGGGPAQRCTGCLDGVADILAIAVADFADQLACRIEHGAGIAAVGAGLLAADIHLGGLVEMGFVERIGGLGLSCLGSRTRLEVLLPSRLEIGGHAFAATFTAEAALLVATKADRGIEIVGAVDPDHTGLELGRDIEGQIDVLAPDGGGEAIFGVVGQGHSFLGGTEAHGHQNRPEDFLGDKGICRRDIGDQRRLEEAALGWDSTVRLVDHRALGGAPLHQFANALDLDGGDHGADIDGLVERITNAQGRHALLELGDEALLDALLHEQAGTGAADLALIEPDGIDQAFDGAVDVGILEDDVGALAAQFERKALAGASGGFADDLADFGGAGEGDLVDIGVVDDGGAGLALAGDDIDHALGQADALANFGEQQGRQRGEFGRLEHDRIAGGKGRGDLPGQHQQREVPGDDLAADAIGDGVGEFAAQVLGPAGVMVEMAGYQRDIDVAAFADRLAVVHALEHREQPAVLLDGTGDGVEILAALVAGQGAPGFEGGAGGFYCSINVLGGAIGDGSQRCAGGGIVGREGLARLGPFTTDEVAELAVVAVEPGNGLVRAFGSRTIVKRLEYLRNLVHWFLRSGRGPRGSHHRLAVVGGVMAGHAML